jgi:RimJ/RimL family protein N-acetyltransferase
VSASQQFIGFLGLSRVGFDTAFTPAVEIGWRLRVDAWGQGYATEGGRAALAFGVQQLGLDEIVSFATAPNLRSQRVMQRLGMTHDLGGDAEHPSVPAENPLRRHVLYRISRTT